MNPVPDVKPFPLPIHHSDFDFTLKRIQSELLDKQKQEAFRTMDKSNIRNHTGNKYIRRIRSCVIKEHECDIDVYAVIIAFAVSNPGIQQAVKKLLCAGLRGKNETIQDLKEAIDAIHRAIQIEEGNLWAQKESSSSSTATSSPTAPSTSSEVSEAGTSEQGLPSDSSKKS